MCSEVCNCINKECGKVVHVVKLFELMKEGEEEDKGGRKMF